MIEYGLAVPGHGTLEVYDMLGMRRATVVDELQEVGHRQVRFDATGLSSGVYFYRLSVVARAHQEYALRGNEGNAGNPSSGAGRSYVETKKMLLLR